MPAAIRDECCLLRRSADEAGKRRFILAMKNLDCPSRFGIRIAIDHEFYGFLCLAKLLAEFRDNVLDMRDQGIGILVDFHDIEGFPVGPHAPAINQRSGLTLHHGDDLCRFLPEGPLLSRQDFAGVGENDLVGSITLLQRLILCRYRNGQGAGGKHGQKLASHNGSSHRLLIGLILIGLTDRAAFRMGAAVSLFANGHRRLNPAVWTQNPGTQHVMMTVAGNRPKNLGRLPGERLVRERMDTAVFG
jgi:hypothetical protein